ncbi:GNAT family N-acetyltransferase, partial [Bacillus cereus]|nr:GNAT family N-acetyltransferase [Bacillus cereus]
EIANVLGLNSFSIVSVPYAKGYYLKLGGQLIG